MSTSHAWLGRPRHSGWFWIIPAAFFVLFIGLVVAWIAAEVTGLAVLAPFEHPGWLAFPFGFFLFLLFAFFLFRLAWWGAGWGAWGRRYWRGWGDAREIVRERYARGEISRDEYTQVLRDLEQGPGNLPK